MLRSSGDLAYTRRSFVTSGKVTARGDLEAGQKGWSCSGSPGRERDPAGVCAGLTGKVRGQRFGCKFCVTLNPNYSLGLESQAQYQPLSTGSLPADELKSSPSAS